MYNNLCTIIVILDGIIYIYIASSSHNVEVYTYMVYIYVDTKESVKRAARSSF